MNWSIFPTQQLITIKMRQEFLDGGESNTSFCFENPTRLLILSGLIPQKGNLHGQTPTGQQKQNQERYFSYIQQTLLHTLS